MNYEEWKLLNECRKKKEMKREREMVHRGIRGMHKWGYYTQWSIPTLIVFAIITLGIVLVCIKCNAFIYEQLQSLV